MLTDGTELFTAGQHGVNMSSDTGTTWKPLGNNMVSWSANTIFRDSTGLYAGTDDGLLYLKSSSSNWEPSGLPGLNVTTLTKTESNLAAGTNEGVYLSSDNGISWQKSNDGLSSIYIHLLKYDRNKLFAGTGGGGFCISYDKGLTWAASNNGLSSTFVTALAAEDNSLYVGTYGTGLFISNCLGETWEVPDSGITVPYVRAIAISDSFILAGTGEDVPYSQGGIFRSVNNGKTWQLETKGDENKTIFCFSQKDSNIFAGTWEGKVLFSSNSGKDWVIKNVSDASAPVRALALLILTFLPEQMRKEYT